MRSRGICGEVVGLRKRFGALAARLDPDDLPAAEAPALWGELDHLGRQVAAARTLLARRVEDSLIWQRGGYASVVEYLAAQGGTSIGAARKELDTSKALPELPRTKAALLEGSLSQDQGSLIAEAAHVNPTAEGTLVDAAGRDSFRELKDRSLRAKAAGDPDPEATQARIQRNRCLRTYRDAEGAWNLRARGSAADGAAIQAALAPLIEEVFTKARRAGTRELPEARAFDALVALAQGAGKPASAGPRARHTGLIRCDLAALRRGQTEGDELCEVTGVGPLPVAQAIELLGEAACKLLITRGVDVLNVTTLSRKATAAILAAVAWSSPVCSVRGCGRTITQVDHRVPYAQSGHTTLGELDLLCDHDHELKTHHGWELVEGKGVRLFVPPEHPRHPRHRRRECNCCSSGDPPSTRRESGSPIHRLRNDVYIGSG